MEIKTKYSRNQKVWMIHDNKCIEVKIDSIGITISANTNMYESHMDEVVIHYGFFIPKSLMQKSVKEDEDLLYPTKEELLKSL